MSTFLFTTLPTNDLGLLARSLPIARELQTLGHRVVCSNPAPAPRRLLSDAGFENVLSDHPLYDLMAGKQSLGGIAAYLRSGLWRRRHGSLIGLLRELLPSLPVLRAPASAEVTSMDHAGAVLGMLNPGFVRANCRALLEIIERCQPDVIVDFWNPFAVMAARVAKRPVVTVIQADAHPQSQGFLWWKARPAAPSPSPARAVNRVLGELGLPSITRLEDLSVGDLTLVVGSPATDPLPPAADVTYIGLTLWQQDGARLPSQVEALGRDRPLIWVYSGNPHYGSAGGSLDSAVVLEACIEALRDQDFDVLLTTGHHALPRRLLPLPPRFHHEPFVPGIALASRCDLLVHHGGYGSCQAGLQAGKPAVILPTYAERESNARRLAAIGAAELVTVLRRKGRKFVDADVLRSTVHRVLADPSYAARAREAGEALRAFGGPARAASLIAELARSRPSGSVASA